jgi:hypothetical protein
MTIMRCSAYGKTMERPIFLTLFPLGIHTFVDVDQDSQEFSPSGGEPSW